MKLVVFGLAVTSSWGNGHATLWRALARALARRGVDTVFFERDQPFYANTRDNAALDGLRPVIYQSWADVSAEALQEIRSADVAMVTSYCPDGPDAAELVRAHAPLAVYYDMDTPITLASLGESPVAYLPRGGLAGFDMVLSYTGGRALDELGARLGARNVRPLFGSVDPDHHHLPVTSAGGHDAALTHLGTYAPDRRLALDELFVHPAERLPARRFLLGGAQYPQDFVLPANVEVVSHVAPADHSAFFGAAPLTLNVTRGPMAAMGFCPSGRLFEAAACGTAVISDVWEGLDTFFTPGEEILFARTADDVVAALAMSPADHARLGRRARERVLDEHTADHRARELLRYLEETRSGTRGGRQVA